MFFKKFKLYVVYIKKNDDY